MPVSIRLKIAGDGPLAAGVKAAAERNSGIEWLGEVSRDRVVELMQEASVLIFPSVWYEGFPMAIVEAFAVGLPVIASNIGSMSSLIQHGRTGLHFRAADAADLARQVEWASTRPSELLQMRVHARREFDENYTAPRNYELLTDIYRRASASVR